jgi:hypothetical protein
MLAVSRHGDERGTSHRRQIRLQTRPIGHLSASDYGPGLVLAFTNHPTCEMIASTGYFRGRAPWRRIVPEILAAWCHRADILPGFPVRGNGKAIQKATMEQASSRHSSNWAQAFSVQLLPPCEYVLDNELIPWSIARRCRWLARRRPKHQYQSPCSMARCPMASSTELRRARVVVGPGKQVGGWKCRRSSLPVIDPAIDSSVEGLSRAYRRRLVHAYLGQWNAKTLAFFIYEAKMSQFHRLWAAFTCQRRAPTDTMTRTCCCHSRRRDRKHVLRSTTRMSAWPTGSPCRK